MTKPPALFGQMSVLGDPMRSRLLLVLERNELTVGELCSVVQAPQSTVSRHLKALSDAGWLSSRADGTNRRYAMAASGLDAPLRALWLLVRKETAGTLAAQHDERRLGHVLAARRSRSEEFFRAGAAQWDRLRDELFGRRFFMPALLGLLDEDAVVADLGCGTGQAVDALAPFVSRVIAVDASASMLRAAKKRLAAHANVDLRLGTLEALPVDDASLDAATLFLVLHHVADPSVALGEVARALKPGGRLVLVDMLPHDRDEYRAQMGHLWLGFAEADVERLLGEAGFGGVRHVPLPSDPRAKGPALFAARAVRRASASRHARSASRRSS
ncbi:MAG TPA: metalloregulator ArsR/SmtB family transcription factor [Candidatus Polarisedimenticolaceae bacterium]|nr:metalloregulator ArsR/SmtB family transcription factor [Candidatus Polarisedimenticolaceae bacterium]